jgi:hypothetical protein
MTVMLPEHKITSLLRDYFAGINQVDVAARNGVDQSTVSNYTQRFKRRTSDIGLSAAAKEFGVMNEIDSLRSLAVELSKTNLTIEGAKQGLHFSGLVKKLGVGPDEYPDLISMCRRAKDQGFVDAALRLKRLEENTGAPYKMVVSRFEELVPKVQSLQQKKEQLEGDIGQLASAEAAAKLRLFQTQATEEKERARQEAALKDMMARSSVCTREIEEVSKLKRELVEAGLDLPTITKLASEFKTEINKVDLTGIKDAIRRHSSLSQTLAEMQAQRQTLETKLSQLHDDNLDEENKQKCLSNQIAELQGNINEREKTLADLDTSVNRKRRQWDIFEWFMAMVSTSPSTGAEFYNGLVSFLESVMRPGGFTSKSAEELRSAFVRAVMGDYLHCFRCDFCGAKFILNRSPYYRGRGYTCPACASMFSVKADDSFITEMVNPSTLDKISLTQRLQEQVDRLKPLEVFLDIPCAICEKPMPNDRLNREGALKVFKEAAIAHPGCWNTPAGQTLYLKVLAKEITDLSRQIKKT